MSHTNTWRLGARAGLLIGALLCLAASSAWATHGLAGEITYTYVPDPANPSRFTNTYRIRLTTYINRCAAGVDNCTAEIEVWSVVGANRVQQIYPELQNIPRSNGPMFPGSPSTSPPCPQGGVQLRTLPGGGCVIFSIYEATVTFRGQGVFELRYFFANRTANVINIPGSDRLNWAVQTVLFNIPTRGVNNSARLLNAPIDDACTNVRWTHNPGGFDPDGDSLSYELVPSQDYGPPFVPSPRPAPGYVFPNLISPGPNNQFTIDARTGLVTWERPQAPGIYNFALRVIEWRSGQRIADVLRDIAIIVSPCLNRPPVITAITDTCIKPNQTLNFSIRVYDPDPLDSVFLYLNNGLDGNNGPFLRGATIIPPNNPSLRPQLAARNPSPPPTTVPPGSFAITTQFQWTPSCTDVRTLAWQADLYANDDFTRGDGQPTLADNRIVTIRVVGPPVTGVTATAAANRSVQVQWSVASCPNVVGYDIYRAADSTAAVNDSCCDGAAGPAYSFVGRVNGRMTTSFTDGPDLPFRGRYCYRVAARYDAETGPDVLGCFSAEACVTLRRDFPVLLNADVVTTSATAGEVFVRWRRPNTALIDPMFFPPPYTYRLLRADGVGGTGFAQVATGIAFADTQRTVTGLNTVANGHTWRVNLIDANGQLVTRSDSASTIYLTATGANQAVVLNFSSRTGWVNTQYTIYRAATINGPFIPLITLPTPAGDASVRYVDPNLAVGVQQCYYVESVGSFNNPSIHTAPLVNRSNRACALPVDTIPPCPPAVTPSVICDSLQVQLSFSFSPSDCDDDISGIIIYYKPDGSLGDDTYVVRDTVSPSNPTFVYGDAQGGNSFIGCYAYAPIDSSGNLGERSAPICLGDECPYFALPNVITPNGDGNNDRFIPLSYDPFSSRAVRSIVCYIYDRWGRLLSTSTNKENLWDGRVNGQPAVEGAYVYVVELVLESSDGGRKIRRTGTLTVVR